MNQSLGACFELFTDKRRILDELDIVTDTLLETVELVISLYDQSFVQ